MPIPFVDEYQEYIRFRQWIEAKYPAAGSYITESNYRKSPLYGLWIRQGSPSATTPTAQAPTITPMGAPTTSPTALLTTEQYLTGYARQLERQFDEEGTKVYTEDQIDQMLASALSVVDTRGVEAAPYYAEIVGEYADLSNLGDILKGGIKETDRATLELTKQKMQQDLDLWQEEFAWLKQKAQQGTGWEQQQAQVAQRQAQLPYEQMTAYERAQQELGWLPYQQMTAYEQADLGLQEREWQSSLMANPFDWLERWFAMQSGQYPQAPQWTPQQFPARQEMPSWMTTLPVVPPVIPPVVPPTQSLYQRPKGAGMGAGALATANPNVRGGALASYQKR